MHEIGKQFEPEFKTLYNETPLTLKRLNGINELDPFVLADKYIGIENIADVSIDPNANITGKSPVNFQSEIFKPIMKVRSMHTAWKLVKEKFGESVANECIDACMTGKLYHHDWVKYDVPYCFAIDTSHWMQEGRPYGWLPGGVPRKLQSFIGQTVEVAMDLSQEHAGAVALANVLVNAAFYSYHDRIQIKNAVEKLEAIVESNYSDDGEYYNNCDLAMEIVVGFFAHSEADFNKKLDQIKLANFGLQGAAMFLYDKYVEDLLQHLVHVLHNTFRVGGDSPFTNISLFCRETIKKTFAEAVYPDFTHPEDIIDEIMHIQLLFAKFFSEGSPITGKNYRFPVCTINFRAKKRYPDKGEQYDPELHFTPEELEKYPSKKYLIMDEDFKKQIGKLNAKRGVFNIHRGDKLASCCRLSQSMEDLRKAFRMDTFGNGGMSLGCYDDETEVLTNNGWKLFKDLEKGKDLICTLNKETKEIEYHLPLNYMQGYYSGEMHHYKHRSLDLLVTPNHNMMVTSRKTGEIVNIQSQDLGTGYNLMRSGAKLKREVKEMIKIGDSHYSVEAFFKFLGMYLGDGGIYHKEGEAKERGYEIYFQLKKQRKIDYLLSFIEDLDLPFNISKPNKYGEIKISIYSKDFYPLLLNIGKVKEKRIPRFILQKYGAEELSFLLEGLMNSDGMLQGDQTPTFYTSSAQLKDDFIELCALLGIMTHENFRTRMTTFPDGRKAVGSCYEISLLYCSEIHKLSKYRQVEEYSGMIYCVEVPNNTLLVRRRGAVTWCGNSHRVVALNLHGIACEAIASGVPFVDVLYHYMQLAETLLIVHKEWLKRIISTGLLKFFNISWEDLNMYFSTFGFVGLWDSYQVLSTSKIYEAIDDDFQDSYREFVSDTFNFMESYANTATTFNEEYAFNVEEVPAENAAPKLAEMDNYVFGDQDWYQPVKLLSNQIIPLYEDVEAFERLEIMGDLMDKVSGGAICHFNVDGSMTEEASCRLIDLLLEEYGLVHFAIEIGTTTCVKGHTSIGIFEKCPECGSEIQTWTARVVGFNSDVVDWTSIRKNWEFQKRSRYSFV